MADRADGAAGPRVPTREDIVRIVAALNRADARYVIIGGIALAFHGYARATQDIDLLVDDSAENIERVRQALVCLADSAVLEVAPGDVAEYTVVRIMDEVIVDLLGRACSETFDSVRGEIETFELDSVNVPVLAPQALIRTKQTVREKDRIDCQFLSALDDADSPSAF